MSGFKVDKELYNIMFPQNKIKEYCGGCNNFLHEDTTGNGICGIDGKEKLCSDKCDKL